MYPWPDSTSSPGMSAASIFIAVPLSLSSLLASASLQIFSNIFFFFLCQVLTSPASAMVYEILRHSLSSGEISQSLFDNLLEILLPQLFHQIKTFFCYKFGGVYNFKELVLPFILLNDSKFFELLRSGGFIVYDMFHF